MRRIFIASLALIAMSFTLSSCNCYTKMMKETPASSMVTTSPEILTLKGDNVVGTLNVKFPEKVFHKYGVLKVTPVLKYNGGEAVGEPKFLQGEKVQDNYTVISYKNGGAYQQALSFPFKEEMRISTLVLRVEAKCLKKGNKIKNFTEYETDIPVSCGVSSLQLLADNYAKVAIAPDAFVRNTQESESAKIMFQVNRHEVRKAQLNSEEIATLQKFITESNADPKRTVGNTYTQSYASPEGPTDFNDKLSKNRGTSTEKALAEKFKKEETPAGAFDINPMGEDWEGFKELVAQSDIQDKDLILQVLSMYNDPQVREREIRNMSAVYVVLKDKVLPELRRSKMTVTVDVEGLTDDELRAAVQSDIKSLKLEEMLFAATLFEDNATKGKIYKAAADQYNDFRAWNNLGVVRAKEGKYSEAKDLFTKASNINNSNPQVINNLGVVALAEGKKAEAANFFAASTAPEAKYNKGLVEMANGNYSAAISSLDGYNKALAQYLNGDVSSAKSSLRSMDNCWRPNYLKAVIAAQEGDVITLKASLKKAIELNPEAKTWAESEINFMQYREELSGIVNMPAPMVFEMPF